MIILNTLTTAVSEYSLSPQSITPTHMGDANGLYRFGGDLDGDQPIVSEVVTGTTLLDSSLKKRVAMVYFSMKGEGVGELIVRGESEDYRYSFPVRETGQSRCQPGQGIRENYLAFGLTNPDGDNFQLDRIEVEVTQSKTRRV
jgi:hypothetical protein